MLLVLIGLVALALPLAVVTLAPPLPVTPHARVTTTPPPPQAPPPAVEPVRYVDLTPDQAQAANAAIPFSTEPSPPARPFRLADDAVDLARATDCLAAAEVYEAGDHADWERAIAQVVVNRARHPAFPDTICGVVFEGSDRSTGCQFTFTCDGALDRWHPTADQWAHAQAIATEALTGSVDRTVGYATHYHTDWVVPYWAPSLDKIAAVGPHLFYRWPGWWGTGGAFRQHIGATEPVIALLTPLSPAHAAVAGPMADPAALAASLQPSMLPKPLASDPDTFLATLDPSWTADMLPAVATATCGARTYCKFMAWLERMPVPHALPLDPQQLNAMAFSYLRDAAHGFDRPLWNCDYFPRDDKRDCMKQQLLPMAVEAPAPVPTPTATPTPTPSAAKAATAAQPDTLSGVHRKPPSPPLMVEPLPTPTPRPKPR